LKYDFVYSKVMTAYFLKYDFVCRKDSCFATSSFSPIENKCQWLSGYCGTVFGRANCSDELLTFDMVERTGVEKTSVVCTLILDFRSVLPN
jgi:hypothetical protein